MLYKILKSQEEQNRAVELMYGSFFYRKHPIWKLPPPELVDARFRYRAKEAGKYEIFLRGKTYSCGCLGSSQRLFLAESA